MKLKFKHQAFQLEAVQAIIDCFSGQPGPSAAGPGSRPESEMGPWGTANPRILLSDEQVLANIQRVQQRGGLDISPALAGRFNLTVEMETGTGKTYTYIRTLFELYRNYGWRKFMVVVPSIAVREGVFKSFQMTEDHFLADFGHRARYFIYNSRQLHQLESFASEDGLQVMIINAQAFNAGGREARRIHQELDAFQSRRPIDVASGTHPILIIDEPQSVEGQKTREALELFNPLFTIRYSATHRQEYNKVFRLDALDAFKKKLVKKIQVKGISVHGTAGTGYLYLEGIELSVQKPPVGRLEVEQKRNGAVRRVVLRVAAGADLFQLSGGLEQYRGYRVADINGAARTLTFLNGNRLNVGQVQGDLHDLALRRLQIRETILSHLVKERNLFHRGVKVISLFFIDEVAKYRRYDEEGRPVDGEYAEIFVEEYRRVTDYLTQVLLAEDGEGPYLQYLQGIEAQRTHKGYFSIDRKTSRFTDSRFGAGEIEDRDADTFQLIMKDKETLLSPEEPTRFIFSHSALREGWDNPNVFQICTLKHSDSVIGKRQEVGRGLRLCVNAEGERVDDCGPGTDVHDINVLTVVASESYEDFARGLQAEMAETLPNRSREDLRDFLQNVVSDASQTQNDLFVEGGLRGGLQEVKNSAADKTFQPVTLSSAEWVPRCIEALNRHLELPAVRFVITEGSVAGPAPASREISADSADPPRASAVRYDLVGKMAEETGLTRKTAAVILSGIHPAKFALFRRSPEQFILETAKWIRKEKQAALARQSAENGSESR